MEYQLPAGGATRKDQLLLTSTILTGLGTIFVFLRMYTRGVLIRALGKDDWTMFAAWVVTLMYLASLLLGIRYGQGLPSANQRPEWLVPTLKIAVAIESVYYIITYLIKVSILFFYLRLAVEPKFRTVILYTIYVLTAFLIACQAVVFFQCKPLEKAWLPHKYPNSGTCTSITTFFYSTSVFNIVSDVWILILPVKLVWSVQRHITQKIALFGVFLMGIFACIASCVRLYTIKVYALSKDPIYDSVPINIWSMIEINIAIICASVPALRALMNIKKQKRNSSAEISIPKDRLGIFQYIFRNQEHSPNARSAHSASTSSSNRRSGGSKPAFALGNLTPMHTRAIFTNTVSSPSHIHHTHSRHPSMHLMFSDSEERIVTKDNSNESDHEAVPVGIALSKSASHGPQGQGNAPEHGGIGYLREVEITVEDRSLPLPTTSTSAVRPSPRPKRSSSTALSISKGIEIMKSSWGKPSVEDDRTDPEQQLVHTRSW